MEHSTLEMVEDQVDPASFEVLGEGDFDLSLIDLMVDLDPGFLAWDEVPVSEDRR